MERILYIIGMLNMMRWKEDEEAVYGQPWKTKLIA